MTTVLRAIQVGFNMEVEHNERMRLCGYHGDHRPVPPPGYRLLRAAHMGQMAARERVALFIAPWLDDSSGEHIEAHLS